MLVRGTHTAGLAARRRRRLNLPQPTALTSRSAYVEYLRKRSARQIADDQALIESSNDIALHDAEW